MRRRLLTVSQTVFQLRADVAVTATELLIFGGTFPVTSIIAAVLAVVLLRSVASHTLPRHSA